MKRTISVIAMALTIFVLTFSTAGAVDGITSFDYYKTAYVVEEVMGESVTADMPITAEQGYNIASQAFAGFVMNPDIAVAGVDNPMTYGTAAKLLRYGCRLPLLCADLYSTTVVDDELFSDLTYGIIDDTNNANEFITLEQFCRMLDIVLNPIETYDFLSAKSGIEYHTFGISPFNASAWVEQAEWCLRDVPEALINHFNKNNYEITLMPFDVYNEAWEENWGTNEIGSIACYSLDGGFLWSSELTVMTMAHEMGHHLQMWFGDYKKFAPIYEAEVDAICEYLDWDYARTDIDEGFAVAYSQYVEHPDDLKVIAPKTFAYIEETLSKVPE